MIGLRPDAREYAHGGIRSSEVIGRVRPARMMWVEWMHAHPLPKPIPRPFLRPMVEKLQGAGFEVTAAQGLMER